MRSRLAVLAGGLTLVAALAVPAGAQASVSHSGSAHVNATPATAQSLKQQGCGTIWNEGYAQYAWVDQAADWPLTFAPLSYFGVAGAPEFCNLSVTTVNGAFEIMDVNDPGSNGNTWGCLAVDTQTGDVHDDTPSACWDQNYAWDQWYGINTHTTYHSQTVWEFKNKYNGECIKNNGFSWPATYATCGANSQEYFVWTGSNL